MWHITDATTTTIFSRGTVTLNLELFAFAQSGQGQYREVVDLVRVLREFREDCATNLKLPGRRDVQEWTFQTQQPSRTVTWTKLPDGRVEIRDAGVDPVTLIATVTTQVATANFSTTAAGPFTQPTFKRFSCEGLNAPTPVPPLEGVPFRRVEWSLARQ
jgi:hypothetical protein